MAIPGDMFPGLSLGGDLMPAGVVIGGLGLARKGSPGGRESSAGRQAAAVKGGKGERGQGQGGYGEEHQFYIFSSPGYYG